MVKHLSSSREYHYFRSLAPSTKDTKLRKWSAVATDLRVRVIWMKKGDNTRSQNIFLKDHKLVASAICTSETAVIMYRLSMCLAQRPRPHRVPPPSMSIWRLPPGAVSIGGP